MALSALALLPMTLRAETAAEAPKQVGMLMPSRSTLDVPIEDIAASPRGCAILDKDFPSLRRHPMYGFFKSMSLHQIAAMSHGKITPDMLAQAQADLSALSFKAAVQSGEPVDIEDPAPPRNHASFADGAPQ